MWRCPEDSSSCIHGCPWEAVMWALSLLAGWPAAGGAAVWSGMGWGAPTVLPGLLPTPLLPRPRRLLRPKHKSWSPGFRGQQAARITVFTCRPRPARPLRDTCDFTGSTARTCQKNTSVFASSSHFSLPVTQGPRLAESFPPTRPRRTILPGSRAARKLGRRRRVLNPESPGRRDRACFSSVSRP